MDYPTLPPGGAFYPGDVEAYGGIVPTLDSIVEGTETVSLTLTPGPGSVIGPNNTASINILDAPVVTIASTVPNASELGSPGTFTILRSGSAADPLTVLLAASGSATSGSDYAAVASSVTIQTGETSAVLPITPLPDSLSEGSETVTLTALPSANYFRGAPSADTITLDDWFIDAWRFSKFGADANNPLIAGDLADPDADGLANLQEYAFNLDPLATSEGPVFSLDNTTLSLTYRRHLLATDIALTLEEASTLSTWTSGVPSEQILSDDTITRLIRATVPRSGEQQFLRVRVERQ